MNRAAYAEAIKIRPGELDDRIAILSALAEQTNLDAQSDLTARMARVHSKREELVTRLNEARVASEGAWEALRQQVEKVDRELEAAIDETRACRTI